MPLYEIHKPDDKLNFSENMIISGIINSIHAKCNNYYFLNNETPNIYVGLELSVSLLYSNRFHCNVSEQGCLGYLNGGHRVFRNETISDDTFYIGTSRDFNITQRKYKIKKILKT